MNTSVQSAQKKLVVIGLDGSTWDLLQPLVDAGKLPNIARMQQDGSYAQLNSTHPAHTAPAWTTFATGTQPTRHGCLDFLVAKNDIDSLELIDSTKIPYETIYETMARHYKKPVLINLPNTFPPKLPDATIITSLMTRGEQYVFPTSLLEKYPELVDYPTSPDATLRVKDNYKPYMKHLVALEEKRIELAKQLFQGEDWDFFFFLSSATDWMSHVVYDKALTGEPDAIAVWERVDAFIGWVLSEVDDNTNVMIMSDHGFTVYHNIFFVNRWLEEQGYLHTTNEQGSFNTATTGFSKKMDSVRDKRLKISISPRMRSLLGAVSFVEKIAKWFYFKIVKRFLPVTVRFEAKIDLSRTQVAFPRGSAATMLYVNDTERFEHGIVKPKDRAALAKKIQAELQTLTDDEGKSLTGNVYTAEELYGLGGTEPQPDLFIEFGSAYVSGSMHSAALTEKTLKNYHDQRGIFAAIGPDIQSKHLPEQSIIDMAPTMIHAMGLPLPAHYEGKPLPIFSQHSSLNVSPTVEESAALPTNAGTASFSDIDGIDI